MFRTDPFSTIKLGAEANLVVLEQKKGVIVKPQSGVFYIVQRERRESLISARISFVRELRQGLGNPSSTPHRMGFNHTLDLGDIRTPDQTSLNPPFFKGTREKIT